MNEKTLAEYCTGCGLCKSVCNVNFFFDDKGYSIPQFSNKEQIQFCEKVCPAAGVSSKKMNTDQIWGQSERVYMGWSGDPKIREKASSGGILSSLCCYLLNEKIVDGIIQTTWDEKIPYRTKTVISRTSEDVENCMGSRYSISSPLMDICNLLSENKTYAFVGKPCDAAALRMFLNNNNKLTEKIKYIFSFFCAGEPSEQAQKKLLKQLGCESEEECLSLQYRGHGWPGFATAEKKDGAKQTMTYNDSWGKILGRDVRKCCRVCLDGIGEFADVSCGDAWYLTDEGKPDFTEKDGRNVIFARTQSGVELLDQACKCGYIVLNPYNNYEEELKKIQRYQFDRRVTMGAMLTAMQLCGKNVPDYNKETLKRFGKQASLTQKIKRGLGTIKRIKQGKI